MAIDFPDSPSLNDTYVAGGKTYKWDGTAWEIYGPNFNPDILYVDTSNNRVGVNNTSPTVDLDVTGNAAISGSLTADSSTFHVDSTNNRVGIGTTTPTAKLDVAGTTDTDYLTVDGGYVSPYTSRKNLLYNGAMQVSQRGFTATGVSTSGYYTADRWGVGLSSIGAYTQSYESDGPDGFDSSLKISCTTADASPASGDYALLYQSLEGRDVQGLKKGSSSALSLTLSFWVKSNVTGTYIANLLDLDNSRQISAQYSVSSSGVWEYKTITFAGDTSGILDNDNNGSFQLRLWFASGSFFQSGSLQTSWGTSGNNIANGQTNLAAATGNYWQITGVQLELGNAATPFEYVSFSEELNRCMRYYEKSFDYNQTPGHGTSTFSIHNNCGSLGCGGNTYGRVDYKVPKRAAPTMRFYDPGASHTATQNWWRSQSGCTSGTAVSTGISWTARESYASGYMQYSTGAAFSFEYTLEAEL